jgi:hypothetical protein
MCSDLVWTHFISYDVQCKTSSIQQSAQSALCCDGVCMYVWLHSCRAPRGE